MNEDQKRLLTLAGEMATAARRLVGGEDLNGFNITAANVWTIQERAKNLATALDRYDRAVMTLAMTPIRGEK